MKQLFDQWNAMLDYGKMPVIEYNCADSEGNEDYYTFWIGIQENGLVFDVPDSNLECCFSGNVKKLSENSYLVPFDNCFGLLDSYLEVISEEINNGYLVPNNLTIIE